MIICHCLSITDRDLKRAASSSSAEAKPNCARLAGTCCGSCKPMVQKILQSYGPQKPPTSK
ncbi:MAG: bacterioferritin-associated ferredoxin [Planctomycetota bacterium]|jgi:bacterioferritin-associated ferredoxin